MREIGRLPAAEHQAIVDSAELAFRGIDFEPEPISEESHDHETLRILSGSSRVKYGYDQKANAFVHVIEFIGLTDNRPGGILEEHRLLAYWDGYTDDDDIAEYLVGEQGILLDADDPDKQKTIERARQQVRQALDAVIDNEPL